MPSFLASRPPTPHPRRDDVYWPEAKRAALDERYHSDFNRQDRFHDFDHRDRGRYPDHSVDRSDTHPAQLIHGVFVVGVFLPWFILFCVCVGTIFKVLNLL